MNYLSAPDPIFILVLMTQITFYWGFCLTRNCARIYFYKLSIHLFCIILCQHNIPRFLYGLIQENRLKNNLCDSRQLKSQNKYFLVDKSLQTWSWIHQSFWNLFLVQHHQLLADEFNQLKNWTTFKIGSTTEGYHSGLVFTLWMFNLKFAGFNWVLVKFMLGNINLRQYLLCDIKHFKWVFLNTFDFCDPHVRKTIRFSCKLI